MGENPILVVTVTSDGGDRGRRLSSWRHCCFATAPLSCGSLLLWGKPWILFDQTMTPPWCRTPPWGFVFGAGHRHAGLVDGVGSRRGFCGDNDGGERGRRRGAG